jgi:hypothetical protein
MVKKIVAFVARFKYGLRYRASQYSESRKALCRKGAGD